MMRFTSVQMSVPFIDLLPLQNRPVMHVGAPFGKRKFTDCLHACHPDPLSIFNTTFIYFFIIVILRKRFY